MNRDRDKRGINKRILIGIAGSSGSDKTLVAQNLLKDMGSDKVAFIQQDSIGTVRPMHRMEMNLI